MDPSLLLNSGTAAAVSAVCALLLSRHRFARQLKAVQVELEASQARADFAENNAQQQLVEMARLQASLEALQASRQDVEQLREQLRAQFAEDAGSVLQTTSKQFLELADAKLQAREQALAAQLSERQGAIDATLKPLHEQIREMGQLTRDLDSKRAAAMGTLTTRLGALDQATSQLRDQSMALVETLRGNVRVRGRWGEQTLRRLAELGGLVDQCDFLEQTGTSEARPDMIVRLPDNGQLPIDAKAPLEHFLEASEVRDPDQQQSLLKAHAVAVRGHVRALAKRDYPSKLDLRLGMTVLFLPSDAMLSAAIEQLPELFEEAQRSRVLLATPMTLLAMLKTIAVFWNQHQMVENAGRIAKVAVELYDRITIFQEHMVKLGKGLQVAGDSFQAAQSSYSRRIVPTGRKLQELGGADDARRGMDELPEVSMPQVVGDSSNSAEGLPE